MMNGLENLFDAVSLEGWKEDAISHAVLGAGLIGGVAAMKLVENQFAPGGFLAKVSDVIPASVRGPLFDALPLVAGVAVAGLVTPKVYNTQAREALKGASIGLAAMGISRLVSRYVAPSVPQIAAMLPFQSNGLAGLGADPFQRYLNGFPTTAETVNGLPGTAVENVSGLANYVAALQ